MIPYGRHSISDDDIEAVVTTLKSDWLTTGPRVEQFEEVLELLVGAPCVSVSSGTAALHCAYAAIDLQQGDEVITPPITFIATQATAAMFGAKIVFADVQPDTANIDPQAVEAAITPRTKAIVAVDYAGHPADLDELKAIASKYKVYLIEDSAHSIGSKYRNSPVGSIADITTFSFFPTKNMTTAEGGALASIHPELLLKAKKFARQGLIRNPEEFMIKNEGSWHQEVHEFGLNYRLPDVLCALGISQLSRLSAFKEKRSKIFSVYSDLLESVPGIVLPSKRSYVDPIWHLYSVRVGAQVRRAIFEAMQAKGIKVQVNYMPAYWHPVFDKSSYPRGLCRISEEIYSQQISLPIHDQLSIEDQEFIVKSLSELLYNLKVQ
jgi:dTDP-4-amino-4,6-dideoxygalactose transaminase